VFKKNIHHSPPTGIISIEQPVDIGCVQRTQTPQISPPKDKNSPGFSILKSGRNAYTLGDCSTKAFKINGFVRWSRRKAPSKQIAWRPHTGALLQQPIPQEFLKLQT
jgi:hypothetical protein